MFRFFLFALLTTLTVSSTLFPTPPGSNQAQGVMSDPDGAALTRDRDQGVMSDPDGMTLA